MVRSCYRIGVPGLVALLLLLSACEHFQGAEESPVLARMGNNLLTLDMALENIPSIVLSQDTLAALRQYQTTWLEQKILEDEARRIGVDQHPDVILRLERLRSQLITHELKEAILSHHSEELEVSMDEARNYYQANRERFLLEERYVRYRHLTASSRVDAVNARQAIMSGRSWEDVANQYSIMPEMQIQESDRFVPITMAFPDIPPMSTFLEVIGITEISPIRQYGGAYHFVQLMEDKPEGDHPDLEWLLEQIREWLYLEKSRRFINSYKRNLYLRAEANNEIATTDVGELDPALLLHALEEK